jgi:nitrile hydratase subunit beta
MHYEMKYQSQADLGGQPGYGPIDPPPDEPVFHEAWEARVLALTLALGFTGSWNLDQSRAARETLPDYAARSYYQKWLGGLTRLLGERGMVLQQEIECGRALVPAIPVARVLRAEQVSTVLAHGTPYERPATAPARFAAGQTVRTLAGDRPHHCRLPRLPCA